MSEQDIIVVLSVAAIGAAFLGYLFGELNGRINESRRKIKQEMTATYQPYKDGYVKVYKASALLGDDE